MKKIIGMHFGTKSYLKSNRYHTAKHVNVFRPAWWLARFKARVLSFDQVTRSSRSIIFLNQNDVVLVKKKKKEQVNVLQLGFDRVNQVTPGFPFSYFFFNPTRFQPRVGRVPGQPAWPGQVLKLCSVYIN